MINSKKNSLPPSSIFELIKDWKQTFGLMQVTHILCCLGLLSAVGSLNITSVETSVVLLTWTAPFTLDITATDPDITYCVEVVSSTSSATLHSECGITATQFTYHTTWCDEYNFTITPVNLLGNGTQESTEYFQPLLGTWIME